MPITLGTVSGLSGTNANGQAFGVWTAGPGTVVGSGLLSVTYIYNSAISGTSPIALLRSYAQTVTVQVISPTLFANSGMTTTVTATVRDAYGNLIPDAGVDFGLVPSTTLGSVTTPASTDSNGRATSTWTATAGSVVTSGLVIATVITRSGSAAITLIADVPKSLALEADPPSPIAGIGSILTATVTDRFNNRVKNGTPVTFTVSQGSIVSRTATTNGVATSLISDTLVGTRTITATTTGAVSNTTTVTFTPGRLDHIAISPKTVTITAGRTQTYTAQGFDVYNNSRGDVTSSTTFTITPAAGGSWAANIYTSRVAGAWTVTGINGAATDMARLTVNPDVPATTTVHLDTDTLVVNTGTSAAITATLVDTYSNPVPGVTVTPTGYLSPTTLGRLSWPGPTTDLNGQAFGRWLAGTVPGSGVLVVNGASVTVTLAPRLVFLPVVMRNFPPIPTGTLIRIDNGAENTFQITVTLQLSATVQADYIQWMRFSNDGVNWDNWVTFTPTATWKLDPHNGLKTVYAQFAGHWGGVSAPISDDILLFMNGDFTQPDLASWNQDPLNLLSVSSATEPGSSDQPGWTIGQPYLSMQ